MYGLLMLALFWTTRKVSKGSMDTEYVYLPIHAKRSLILTAVRSNWLPKTLFPLVRRNLRKNSRNMFFTLDVPS